MSVISASPAVQPEKKSALGYLVSDTIVMTKRHLLQTMRIPDLWAGATIQPIMFILLFRYVFGGAINTGAETYVNFLMAGIFVQTVIFGSLTTGIGLASDLEKGVIDRFRSLPMSSLAVLLGRMNADLLRNALTVVIMVIVGVLVGFRPEGSVLSWIGAAALLLAFGWVISWVAAVFGLTLRTVEAVQQIAFTAVFPLTFAASTFVPTSTMPGWLQAFANNQPVTHVIDSVRAMLLAQPLGDHLWLSLLWMAGLLIVLVPFCVKRFRNHAGR